MKITLNCPVRGVLKSSGKSSDGLTPDEEFFRVEAIKYLISKGYPKDNFVIEPVVKKFGSGGKNSMRADFAVLDIQANTVKRNDVDQLMDHALLLCEVKRESSDPDYVKSTQVKPLLDFAKSNKCVALYWDNVEQRLFWNEKVSSTKRKIVDGPLHFLPIFGAKINKKNTTYSDLTPSDDLIDVFSRIEDVLHSASIDLQDRYSTMLKLILCKLYDEHAKASTPTQPLIIQDFQSIGIDQITALNTVKDLISNAIKYYSKHLPKPVSTDLPPKLTGAHIQEIARIIGPIKLTGSKREVVQTFYMKFAKDLYKWDLAQYFTPPTVTDFIVGVLNIQFGEHIKDPACGSADFLTAAFHTGRMSDPNFADCVWGTDKSDNAVHVAVLNMLLNGDGKSNIKEEDALACVNKYVNEFDIVVCNPPFGVRIVETNPSILSDFDLGHEWIEDKAGDLQKTAKVQKKQQTGMLFLEACVRQCKPGGRVGIVLPNGYLGNRSKQYLALRKWLLLNCRVSAICSFPRFTFKNSGADVSASIIYLEKRATPLSNLEDDKEYSFCVEMIENVGWKLGDKKGNPLYIRDQVDGSFITNSDGNRILMEDFSDALKRIANSDASKSFGWLAKGKILDPSLIGWSISVEDIISDEHLTLDPKRHCKKFREVQEKIKNRDHFMLGQLVDFLPEMTNSVGKKNTISETQAYEYVEIQDIGSGEFSGILKRGWELPDRAKHLSEPGDIYVGSVWGSVSKWAVIPKDSKNIVFTNGCHRMRMKSGQEQFLNDVIAYLTTEGFAIQMRAFARGSDGLAEVSREDAVSVLIPKLSSKERDELEDIKNDLIEGTPSVISKVRSLITSGNLEIQQIDKRSSHVILV